MPMTEIPGVNYKEPPLRGGALNLHRKNMQKVKEVKIITLEEITGKRA